jgi:hypothetical protein
MIVYVGAGSGPFRDLVIAAGHGQMVSRQAGAFRVPKHGRWAFDNGAFTDWKNKVPFNDEEFLKRLRKIETLPQEQKPDWCVCPDMVGSRMSLAYSVEWRDLVERYSPGLSWYLALQDYVHPTDVTHTLRLAFFEGLFIGGTTTWKLETAAFWVKFGHEKKLPVHLARVNGPNRLQWAVDIGADSVDGTGWVHAGAKWLPYLQNIPVPQEHLFPIDTTLRSEWRKFGAWLRSLWKSPTAFEHRLPEVAEDDQDRYDRIASMQPVEFVEWFERMYGVPGTLDKRTAKEMSPEEFHDWKFGLVDEAERFSGKRPVPPA